jgi:hypothetical protein
MSPITRYRGTPELGSGRLVPAERNRALVPAGTVLIKKAWREPELCYIQRDRISNVFMSNKSSQ